MYLYVLYLYYMCIFFLVSVEKDACMCIFLLIAHFDATCSCLQVPVNEDENVAVLEAKEPPRHHGKSRITDKLSATASAAGVDGAGLKGKKGKTADQIAKRKEKKKSAHLKKLQDAGKYDPARPVKPDPERFVIFFAAI